MSRSTVNGDKAVYKSEDDGGRLIFTSIRYTYLSIGSELIKNLEKDSKFICVKSKTTIDVEDSIIIDSKGAVTGSHGKEQNSSTKDENSAKNIVFRKL